MAVGISAMMSNQKEDTEQSRAAPRREEKSSCEVKIFDNRNATVRPQSDSVKR